MVFTRVFDRQLNLLISKAVGEIDDQSLLQHVHDLNEEGKGIVGLRELADCREITSLDLLSVKGTTIASAAQDEKPRSLLALLVRDKDPHLYGMARAFQMFSEDVRSEVRIFTDPDECIIWLSADEEHGRSISEFFRRSTK